MARACYSNAAIVLLDDPLSAVDPPTASFLLHHCILKLLKNRTVLLVSHATSLVAPHAQLVVKMKNGRVCHQEDCNDITPDFNKERQKRPSAIPSTHKHGSELDSMAKTVGVQLVQDECQAVGSVNLKLYKFYFLSSGAVPLLLGYILSYIISTAAKLLNDFWLKHWTESSTLSEIILFQSNRMGIFSIPSRIFSTVMGISLEENLYFVKVYALLGLGIIVAENLQTVVFLLGSLFASVKLHDKLLKSILRSPLRFFEVTPIGRILNRFSKDIDTIDSFVMPSIRRFVQRILQVLTIIGLISFATPSFLVFTPFIGFFFAHVARRYLSVSRELKRYESTTKSPIFAQFSETLSGAITIRAYGASSRFSRGCNQKVDINHQPYFFVWAANRWLSIRTDLMSALVVFISGCVVVLTNIAPGLAALAITYSLEFSDSLLWAVRTHAELEMSMNSGNTPLIFS